MRALIVEWLRQNADFRIDPKTSLKDFLHQEIYPTWDDYWCVEPNKDRNKLIVAVSTKD